MAVFETALFGDEAEGVFAAPAEEMAERAGARHLGVQLDGFSDVLAFHRFGHAMVIDPAIAMAGDFPICLLHGGDGVRISRQCHGDAENGDRHFMLSEQAMQAPEADAAAIFILRFDGEVALALARRHEAEFCQQRLRAGIAVQDVVLAALFVIDHELDRDARAVRPFGTRWIAPISHHVARINIAHVAFLPAVTTCYSLAPA